MVERRRIDSRLHLNEASLISAREPTKLFAAPHACAVIHARGRVDIDKDWLISGLAFALAARCSSIGPYGAFWGDGMYDRIRDALPQDDSNVLISDTVLWWLPIRGQSGRVSVVSVNGAIAVRDKSIFLEQWNIHHKRLDVTKRIAIDPIESIEWRNDKIQLFNRDCLLGVNYSGGESDSIDITHCESPTFCKKTRELHDMLETRLQARTGK